MAFAGALTATTAIPAAALSRAIAGPRLRRSQLMQHLMVHPDEARGQRICASIALEAPDTAWQTAGMMDEQAFHEATAAWRLRGYGLRRVNAFQTRGSVRYAAIWQLGRSAPADVRTGMDLATFRATAARHAANGLAITQLDAAGTNDGARFSAIWERTYAMQTVHAEMSELDFALQGRVPQLVAGYATSGSVRFAAVFGATSGAQTDLALAVSDYPARARAMQAAGYELRDASGYSVGGKPFLTAVWEKA